MTSFTSLGQHKVTPGLPVGAIVPHYDFDASGIPTCWALCDGTNGTPDLTNRFILGASSVSTGSSFGTTIATDLTHTNGAVDTHDNHGITDAGAHADHTVGQPNTHSAHTVTQASAHSTHSSDGVHNHDAHSTATKTTGVGPVELSGGTFHSTVGTGHTHDAHSAHSGMTVTVYSAHANAALGTQHTHSGSTVSSHAAHTVTQPSTHSIYKTYVLAFIKKTS